MSRPLSDRTKEPTTGTMLGSSRTLLTRGAHPRQADWRRIIGPKAGTGELQHVEAHRAWKISLDDAALIEGLAQGLLDANVERCRKRGSYFLQFFVTAKHQHVLTSGVVHLFLPCTSVGGQCRDQVRFHGVIARRHRIGVGCLQRSEEHTSELQSHLNLVCRLLLEKKHSISAIVHSLPFSREPLRPT